MAVQAAGVPGITSDGMEWFIPAGGRERRPLRPGDHIAPDHPLVREYADRFVVSAEPINAWPVGLAGPELRKAQQAERQRLLPSPALKATPVCARCGAESSESVVLIDQPQAGVKIGLLAGLEDGDPDAGAERYRIEQTFANQARLFEQRKRDLAVAEARWREQHTACPPGTPEVERPAVPDDLPVMLRLATVRGNGQPRTVIVGG
jgi:hypothetical protein